MLSGIKIIPNHAVIEMISPEINEEIIVEETFEEIKEIEEDEATIV